MICPHIRKLVCAVELGLCKAALRRVLNEHHIAVALHYRASVHLVLLVILLAAGFRVGFLVVADKLEAVALYRADRCVYRLGEVAGAAYVMHIAEFVACLEMIPYLRDRQLAHAVHQQLCAAVNEYRLHNTVVPVIVMRESAQRGFQSAYRYLRFRKQPF